MTPMGPSFGATAFGVCDLSTALPTQLPAGGTPLLFASNTSAQTTVANGLGMFKAGSWTVPMVTGTSTSYRTTTFGKPGVPVVGDWTGTGVDRIGTFNNGTWYLDLNGNGVWDPGVDQSFQYGQAGDVPVVGYWVDPPGNSPGGPTQAAQVPVTGAGSQALAGLDTAVTDFMVQYGMPGVGLAVAQNGQLLYDKGFGYADPPITTDSPAASTQRIPSARSKLDSISVPVTLVALSQLVAEGYLKGSDSVIVEVEHAVHLRGLSNAPICRPQDGADYRQSAHYLHELPRLRFPD